MSNQIAYQIALLAAVLGAEKKWIFKYLDISSSQLRCVDFPWEFRSCAGKMCYSVSHRIILENIISIVSQASTSSCTRAAKNCDK